MTDHSPQCCPRCQHPRRCCPEDIAACPCSSLQLSPALQAYLATHYQECLCNSCLIALAQQFSTSQQPTNDHTGKNSKLRNPHL